jgi:hypothetical protein
LAWALHLNILSVNRRQQRVKAVMNRPTGAANVSAGSRNLLNYQGCRT